MKIIVYHSSYGCETGCCGHIIESGPDDMERDDYGFDEPTTTEFEFDHPYGDDPLEWAKNWVREEFGEEHVKDLDWENCRIQDD